MGIAILGGVSVGIAVGVALAARLPVGVAVLLAAVYFPVVVLNPTLAVAMWAPLVFLEGVPALNAGSKAAGLLLSVAWLASVHGGRSVTVRAVLTRHRRLIWVLAALITWLTLSALWADSVADVFADVWHWWAVAVLFLLVATSLPTLRSVQTLIIGLVVGAVAAVLIGVADGDLTRSATAGAVDRLKSGAGDPNVLAAGLVPAGVLAGALTVSLRRPIWRWTLITSIVVLCVGLVASASRGGGIAAVVAALASLVFLGRRRTAAAGVVLLATGALALTFTLLPSAWQRITSYDNGGNGRTEIWTVAWRISQAHPVLGVGLNNFGVQAPHYVLAPGSLKRIHLIVDHPSVVHNIYLQLLAEDGIVALALFLAIATGCLRSAWAAARTFQARGDEVGETLSRAVLVATITLLAAGFFISAGVDTRLWILLALGLALRQAATSSVMARSSA